MNFLKSLMDLSVVPERLLLEIWLALMTKVWRGWRDAAYSRMTSGSEAGLD